jgi:DNA (cytosine-5)-methyltransferase 1
MAEEKKMTAIDLFAGAGGMCLGLERSGIKVVLSNEMEEDFSETHRANFPCCRTVRGDIKEVDFVKEVADLGIEEIDVVAGGPPCQGFSTVGKKDRDDPRNSLFEQFLRCVDEVRPKYVIFENVRGFRTLYSGSAYKGTVAGLESMGFSCVSAVLNAVRYGTPQNRERTIILGWRKDLKPLEMPPPTHGEGLKPFVGLWEAISDLPELVSGQSRSDYRTEPENEYQRLMRAGGTLSDHFCSNYGEKMRLVISKVPPGGSIMQVPEELRPKGYFKNTYARLLPDEPGPTITRNFGTPSSSRCIHPFQDRALSTREGARLQGFPDSFVFCGGKGSKNLQIGNAVPPMLAEAIGRQIVGSVVR